MPSIVVPLPQPMDPTRRTPKMLAGVGFAAVVPDGGGGGSDPTPPVTGAPAGTPIPFYAAALGKAHGATDNLTTLTLTPGVEESKGARVWAFLFGQPALVFHGWVEEGVAGKKAEVRWALSDAAMDAGGTSFVPPLVLSMATGQTSAMSTIVALPTAVRGAPYVLLSVWGAS